MGFDASWLRARQLWLQPRVAQQEYRIKLWRRVTRSLRKFWQDFAVPHWERDWMPLLMSDAGLLYVAAIGMDASHLGQGAERWEVRWQPYEFDADAAAVAVQHGVTGGEEWQS